MKRALALALAAAGCGHAASAPVRSEKPAAAAKAPEVVAADRLAAILKQHRGQTVVVNVFASWCQPCKRELPDLGRLAREHPKLWLLGIDVDEPSAAEDDLARFLAGAPREMTVVRQPGGLAPLLSALALPADWNESVPPDWQRSIPLTFVYDPAGGFATGSVGELLPEALEAIASLAK